MSAEKKNSELMVMRQIIHSKEKLTKREIMPVKELAVMCHTDARRLLKNFSYNSYYLVNVLNENLTIEGLLSEKQVIDAVVREGRSMPISEALQKKSGWHQR